MAKTNNIVVFSILGGAVLALSFLFKKKKSEDVPLVDTKKVIQTIKPINKPKDIFKYKIGAELVSNPKPGFSKIPYYFDPRETKGMTVAFWHVLPGGFVGKIVDRMRREITNAEGKKEIVNLYAVKDVPASFLFKLTQLWVLEKEVNKTI